MTAPNGAEHSDPSLADDYAHWVGRVLDDRYRIEGLLGEGGMGAVFVGEHLKLMKKVAIKVIHPEFAGDGDVAERFAREAVAAGQMDHPHVASATDYGTLPEGGAYLVMQYVRGHSLHELLDAEGAIGWLRACEIGAQVADALAAAHLKGYVHRDLKPDNIMLEVRDDGSNLVKVLDFGIARVASEKAVGAGGRTLTRVGTVIGTPGYMAPEQALGETVDYRADLYALGVVLYEMVKGQPLFHQQELTAIVTRQLTERPPRLSETVDAPVPQELDDLVATLLARDRSERPQSSSDVRDRLRNLLIGATLQAVASGEHELPRLATTALGGASEREPTPLSVPLAKRGDPKTPPVTGASPNPSLRQMAAVATAKTALAVDQVTRQAARSSVPLPIVALGCAALSFVALAIVGLALVFSGGEEPALAKVEHLEPRPVEPPPPDESGDGLEEGIEPPPAGALPAALGQPMADLLLGESERERRRAARDILAYEPRSDVPPFLAALAELERASRCQRKKELVAQLVELGDPRALPAIERLNAEPENGCRRLFRTYDCNGCMRAELRRAITALRSAVE